MKKLYVPKKGERKVIVDMTKENNCVMWSMQNGKVYKKCPQIYKLQAELDKHRWIPADETPDSLRESPAPSEWKVSYYVLEYGALVPSIMTAEQIWLDEGSEVEYYKPIILPKEKGKYE